MSFNDLIGMPFKDGGTGKSGSNPGGFDCYTLAREVFSRFGITLPELNVSVIRCAEVTQKEMDRHRIENWQRIDQLEVPCMLQIYSSNPNYANHVATYIGNGMVIHITLKTNVTIQRLSTIQKQKIEGYYKYVNTSN
jgi:cell wall-associated NlpC family hydrolase